MNRKSALRIFLIALCLCAHAAAQTTEFTHQGQLTMSGSPANGNFDFEFKLFDASNGGNQVGSTVQRLNVAVAGGIYAVTLDLGSAAFSGADRFLDISVRTAGGGGFTPLSPRQKLSSTPYAVKSLTAETANALSASCVGCVTAAQIGGVNGGSVTGTIPVASVPGGSGNYIQNQNIGPQSTSDFNISGTGTANLFNVATQYNIGGNRAFTAQGGGAQNVFGGFNSGVANTTGFGNTFVGNFAGNANTTGSNNSFYGADSGRNNKADGNSFFGRSSGFDTTTGGSNAFFGLDSGRFNTTGSFNAFYGRFSGFNNNGDSNAFFGYQSGVQNTSGTTNAFFGAFAGSVNSTGFGNSAYGYNASMLANNLTNAGAFGSYAAVGASNSLVLGSINGVNLATADTNVGIGTTTPTERLHVVGNGLFTGNQTVSGTSSANIVNATTQYNIAGNRAFTAQAGGAQNVFAGFNAGVANTAGFGNTFVGNFAGNANTTGANNSFVGADAGRNTTGFGNSFFGRSSGFDTTSGTNNTFFGLDSGRLNTGGSNNAFFGFASGYNTAADGNSFFGYQSGLANVTGTSNALFGKFADVLGNNLTNAAAFGANAAVGANNSLVLGSINGINGAVADTKVGIGTTTPAVRFHVVDNSGNILIGNPSGCSAGNGGIGFGATLTCTNYALDGAGSSTFINRPTGGAISLRENNVTQMFLETGGQVGIGTTSPADKLDVNGDIRVGTSGTNGCLNNNNGGLITGTCSSDLRFKKGVTPFAHTLSQIARLRPVYYYWRADEFPQKHFGPALNYGLVAQDVEQVLPELVSADAQGYKQVDYSKLPLLTIEAVKELKDNADSLRATNQRLQRQVDALTALVCHDHPKARVCRQIKP